MAGEYKTRCDCDCRSKLSRLRPCRVPIMTDSVSPFVKCIEAFAYQDPLPPVQRTEQEEAISAMLEEWINAEQEQIAWGGYIRDYLPNEDERTSPEELATRKEFADTLYDNLRFEGPEDFEELQRGDIGHAKLRADHSSSNDWQSDNSSDEVSTASEDDSN
ncbi:hypothetical protein BV20DRAFT_464138 [Pilatotrama ljubarskyi]|nr:hypothetical protein BV20DRAFT_464138 [Pilatotrama ljubarskyi]